MNCPANKDPNELAIAYCESGKKSLMFTAKTAFCPTIQTMCEKRSTLFFTEDKDYFEAVTQNFDDFDAFIFVDRELNDFEKEFFRQIDQRHRKRVVQIVSDPSTACG